MDPPSKSKVRLYQVWKGRNIFFCGGRLIFGPDAASVALSTFLIGTPAMTFCFKMLGKIHKLDPSYGYGVLIAGVILLVLDLTFLFMTSGRNPGIVPRNSRPLESDDSSSTTSMEWINTSMDGLKLPRTKDVIVNGHIIKVKYCDTCMLYRPPRSSHCSICNNCVQKFDHHCPWVGQCIGIVSFSHQDLMLKDYEVKPVQDIVSQKGKADIEMGGMLGNDGSNHVPLIVNKLDYDKVKNSMKEKEKDGSIGFDSFTSPIDQEPRFRRWNSVSGDNSNVRNSARGVRLEARLVARRKKAEARHAPIPSLRDFFYYLEQIKNVNC